VKHERKIEPTAHHRVPCEFMDRDDPSRRCPNPGTPRWVPTSTGGFELTLCDRCWGILMNGMVDIARGLRK
jgi:hypothetical protein